MSTPIGQDPKLAAHNFLKEIKEDARKRIFALDDTGIRLLLGKDLGSKCDSHKDPGAALQNLRECTASINLLQTIASLEKEEDQKKEIEKGLPFLSFNNQLRNMFVSLQEKPYDINQIDRIKRAVQSYVLALLVIKKKLKKEDYNNILNILRNIRQGPLKETLIIAFVEPNDYKEFTPEWENWKSFERAANNYWDAALPNIDVTNLDQLKEKINDSVRNWENETGTRHDEEKRVREGKLRENEGRLKKGIEIYESLAEGKYPLFHLINLLPLYYKDKNLSKLLETFERIKKLDPECPQAHFYLGGKKISGKKEQEAEGIAMLKKSYLADPGLCAEASKLFRKKSLHSEIVDCLDNYIEKHPWDVPAAELLLEALWETKQFAVVQNCIHLVLSKKSEMQNQVSAPLVYLYLGLMQYEQEETKNLPALLEFQKIAIKEIEETTQDYKEEIPNSFSSLCLNTLKTLSFDSLEKKQSNRKIIKTIKERYLSAEDKGPKKKEKKIMVTVENDKALPPAQKQVEEEKIRFFENFVRGRFAVANGIKKKMVQQHDKLKKELPQKKIFKNNLSIEKLHSSQCFLRAIEHGILKRLDKNNFHLFLKVGGLCSGEKNTGEIALQYFFAIDQQFPNVLKNERERIKELKVNFPSFKKFSWEAKEVKKVETGGLIKLKHKM